MCSKMLFISTGNTCLLQSKTSSKFCTNYATRLYENRIQEQLGYWTYKLVGLRRLNCAMKAAAGLLDAKKTMRSSLIAARAVTFPLKLVTNSYDLVPTASGTSRSMCLSLATSKLGILQSSDLIRPSQNRNRNTRKSMLQRTESTCQSCRPSCRIRKCIAHSVLSRCSKEHSSAIQKFCTVE